MTLRLKAFNNCSLMHVGVSFRYLNSASFLSLTLHQSLARKACTAKELVMLGRGTATVADRRSEAKP